MSRVATRYATGSPAPFPAKASGCYLNFSYNLDWVVAQKWLTGVAESHNIGANELNFAKLGIAK